MDFIVNHPTISKFLQQFPSDNWKPVLITTILNGIPHTQIQLKTISENQLTLLPILKDQLNYMKNELDKLSKSLEEPKISSKPAIKKTTSGVKTHEKLQRKHEEVSKNLNNSASKKGVLTINDVSDDRNKPPSRNKSANCLKSSKPPMKPRAIPKYLANVDSKIRHDVQKDIANYKTLCESTYDDYDERVSLSPSDLSEKGSTKGFFNRSKRSGTNHNFSPKNPDHVSALQDEILTKQNFPQKAQLPSSSSTKTNFSPINTSKISTTNTKKHLISSNKSPNLNSYIITQNQESLRPSSHPQFYIPANILSPKCPTIDSDPYKKNQHQNVLQIADNFLLGPLMSELCDIENTTEVDKNTYNKKKYTEDMLGFEENIITFRQKWDGNTSNNNKRISENDEKEDRKKNTFSKDYYRRRSSEMMMVKSPSPIPFDDKSGGLNNDSSYSRYY